MVDEKIVTKITELCEEVLRISKEYKELKATYEKMHTNLHEQRVQLTELSRTNNQSNTVLNEFQKKVVSLTALQKKDMQELNAKYHKEISSLKQTITEKCKPTAVPVTLPNITIKRKPVKKANSNSRKPSNKKKNKARSMGKTVTAKRNPTLSKLAARKK